MRITRAQYLFAALLLSLGVMFAAQETRAADLGMSADEIALFAKEPALTQADMDEYIRLMPMLAKAGNDPASAEKVLAGSKLSQVRIGYLGIKVALAMPIIQSEGKFGAEQLQQFPEVLRPTQADLDLVKKNIPAIMQATMAMMQEAPAK